MLDLSDKLLIDAEKLESNSKNKYLPDEILDDNWGGQLDERKDFKIWAEREELFNERIKQENEEKKELHNIRKKIMERIYGDTKTYIFAVLVILFFYGFGFLKFDSSVIIAFLTTTTFNILGIAVIVAKWLFPDLKK